MHKSWQVYIYVRVCVCLLMWILPCIMDDCNYCIKWVDISPDGGEYSTYVLDWESILPKFAQIFPKGLGCQIFTKSADSQVKGRKLCNCIVW